MDEFNRRYKELVDEDPFRAERSPCSPNAVDGNFWTVTRAGGGGPGRGPIVGRVYEAVFKGPNYPQSSGYECVITQVIEQWDDPGDPPYVEPGEPRPPDWRVDRIAASHPADLSRAHRSWAESVRGRMGRGIGPVR